MPKKTDTPTLDTPIDAVFGNVEDNYPPINSDGSYDALDDRFFGTSTALVPVDEASTELTISRGGLTSVDDLDSSDISYARLSLMQPQSPGVVNDEARPGQWLVSGYSGQSEIVVVPLGVKKDRIFSEGPYGASEVKCVSRDAVTGVGTPGGSCASCPLAEFGKDPVTGKATKPACTLQYNYVCYSEEHGLVALTLSKTATSVAKQLNGFGKSLGFGKFAVVLKSTVNKNGAMTWYTPTLRITKTSPEVLEDASLFMEGLA